MCSGNKATIIPANNAFLELNINFIKKNTTNTVTVPNKETGNTHQNSVTGMPVNVKSFENKPEISGIKIP